MKLQKLSIFILIALLCSSIHAQKKESFGAQMTEFTQTQLIMEYLASGKSMINLYGDEATWDQQIRKLYDSARTQKINQERTTPLDKILQWVEAGRNDSFEHFESLIKDILNCAIYDDRQLLFAIAVCSQMDILLKRADNRYPDAHSAIQKSREEQESFQRDTLIKKVHERFEDDEMKALVKDFENIFPDAGKQLDFKKGKGSVNNFNECEQLFHSSMNAFWKLNKCSALADFREWGTHMLNYLLLDYHPVMVEEFKIQLDNYKKSFKVQ